MKLAKELDWDGYSLDGFGCWTTCYCPACKKAYKDETGLDIPFKETPEGPQPFSGVDGLEHPGFTKYVKWRMRRYSRFVHKWQKALKDMKSDFVAMPWSSGPGRWFIWTFAPNSEGSDHSNRLVDAPILELFWDFPPDQGEQPSAVIHGSLLSRPVGRAASLHAALSLHTRGSRTWWRRRWNAISASSP